MNEESMLFDGHPGAVLSETPIPSGLLTAQRWALVTKSTLDVLLSALFLVLLLPVLLAAAIAVALSSRGPVIYRQTRIGLNGIPFTMYKFRSMRREADVVRADLFERNDASGPVFKMRDDPRITPVGRILRRFSIDELPQLVNVLMREMTLVGPRPPLPEEYETYGARERMRLLVTPGLTCIWQVSGRSDIDFATWVDLDIEYIQTWTLLGDLRLLLKTIMAVVTGRGAY